jgi:hypothetical protein
MGPQGRSAVWPYGIWIGWELKMGCHVGKARAWPTLWLLCQCQEEKNRQMLMCISPSTEISRFLQVRKIPLPKMSRIQRCWGHVALNMCSIFSQILRAFKAPMQSLSPGLGDWVRHPPSLQVLARAVNACHGNWHPAWPLGNLGAQAGCPWMAGTLVLFTMFTTAWNAGHD